MELIYLSEFRVCTELIVYVVSRLWPYRFLQGNTELSTEKSDERRCNFKSAIYTQCPKISYCNKCAVVSSIPHLTVIFLKCIILKWYNILVQFSQFRDGINHLKASFALNFNCPDCQLYYMSWWFQTSPISQLQRPLCSWEHWEVYSESTQKAFKSCFSVMLVTWSWYAPIIINQLSTQPVCCVACHLCCMCKTHGPQHIFTLEVHWFPFTCATRMTLL